MTWPPKIGEPLPRAEEAIGVRKKLLDYSLDVTHEHGGPKARGFERILGITIDDVDYVEDSIRTGILATPIRSIRDNAPYGVNCVVEFPLQGVGERSMRMIDLRTTWILVDAVAQPRLLTAYLRP